MPRSGSCLTRIAAAECWRVRPRPPLAAVQNQPRDASCCERPPQTPSWAWISRETSAPSARPLVSRMTWPTIGPIALALPARTRSAASSLAASGVRHDPGQLALVLDRREPLALDDRLRVSALGHQPVEHLAADADAHLLGRHERHQRGERRGRDARVGGILDLAQAREQLDREPVGERLGLDLRGGRRERPLEEVAQLAAEGEHVGAVGGQARPRPAGARPWPRAARPCRRGRPRSSPGRSPPGRDPGSGK